MGTTHSFVARAAFPVVVVVAAVVLVLLSLLLSLAASGAVVNGRRSAGRIRGPRNLDIRKPIKIWTKEAAKLETKGDKQKKNQEETKENQETRNQEEEKRVRVTLDTSDLTTQTRSH